MVPRVFWRYTTARVLTQEMLPGTPLAHLDLDAMPLEDRRTLASRLAETWMKMVFLHGFFHADPHPANILVPEPDRLGLIDFGMVGALSERDREAAVRLFVAIVDQDVERMPRRLKDMGVRYPPAREAELRDQLGVIFQRYYGVSLSEIDAQEILREIFGTVYRLRVELPVRWLLLDKAVATLAGVGLEIYPDFNVFETARPYARRMVMARIRPDKLAGRVREDAERYVETFLEYPFLISDVLRELRDGEVRVSISPEGFTEHSDRLQASVNRLSIAAVATALILGSCLVAAFASSGPRLVGLALIALPGFLAGFALTVWLMIGILRSGRW
jgi:ubiquinone biosynthesis protein